MSKKKKFTEMVGVLFKPETIKQLQEVTDEQEVSNSEFIRGIIEKELNEKGKLKMEKVNKENIIWTYFNKYFFEEVDPAEPYYGWENDKQLLLDPYEMITYDFIISCTWNEKGMAVNVESLKNEVKILKDYNQDNDEVIKEILANSKVVFQSGTGEDQETCKLIITIDERPISEFIDLPLNQYKRMIEKLAEAQMAFYCKFCLWR